MTKSGRGLRTFRLLGFSGGGYSLLALAVKARATSRLVSKASLARAGKALASLARASSGRALCPMMYCQRRAILRLARENMRALSYPLHHRCALLRALG
jgi:hypothetical protein